MLEKKIQDKSVKIGIVGLGYVGLPLAVAFSEAKFKVLGFDAQQKRVNSVCEGRSYIADINNQRLSKVVRKNLLEATIDQQRLEEVDVICVCVPTPVTKSKEPDLTYVIHECEEISKHLQPGQLVVLESTTYPGTTRDVVLPILERSKRSVGKDFYLAYSPERIDPGNKEYNVRNTPKIVSGIDAKSTKLTELLYRQVVKHVVPVSSLEVAEMTKVYENVFRNVNIALVNELAQLCEKMGLSVWEVIDAAATKPFGYMLFYPGPGVGGHCIPVDPYFLFSKAREFNFPAKFSELAAEINEQMPHHVISRIMEALNARGKNLNGAKILVLGVAYKKNQADWRESPSIKLLQLLRDREANVSYNDRYVPTIQVGQDNISSVELTAEALSTADCVVVATDHSYYDIEKVVRLSQMVFDARGVTKGLNYENILRLGE